MAKVLKTGLWDPERAAGLLLTSALMLPIIVLLVIAVRGDLMDIFSQIGGAGQNSFVRRLSLSGWIVTSLLYLAGLTLLSTFLEEEGEPLISRVALIAMLFTTVLLVLEATIHLTFGAWAAEERLRTGNEPEFFSVIFQWASVTLQRVYVPLGYIALILFGWAILRTNWLPDWSGWLTLAWGAGMLVLLILTRVTLPATLLIPGTAIGIWLLFRS